MPSGGRLVFSFLGDKSSLDRAVRGSRTSIAGLVNFAKSALPAIGGAFALAHSVRAAEAQDQAEKKLAATLRATGFAAGLTAGEIKSLATERQKLTSFGDESTIDAAGILATFRQIRGEGFKKTLTLAQDVSSVMGTDLRGSVVQLGKALNDPIRGMSQLTRVGITFNDQQRDEIRNLQESGELLKAQKVILDELASEFGGAAQEMASPLEQIKNDFGDLTEQVGSLFSPAIKGLAIAFRGLNSFVSGAADAVSGFFHTFPKQERLPFRVEKRQGPAEDLGLKEMIDRARQNAFSLKVDTTLRPIESFSPGAGRIAERSRLRRVNEIEKAIAAGRTEVEKMIPPGKAFRMIAEDIGSAFGGFVDRIGKNKTNQLVRLANTLGNKFSGVTDAIEETDTALESLKSGGGGAIDQAVASFRQLGASGEALDHLRSNLEEIDALTARNRLKDELATLRGEKINPNQDLISQRDAIVAAQRLKDSLVTPAERLKKDLHDAMDLRAKGLIDDATFRRAATAIGEQSKSMIDALGSPVTDLGQAAGPARAIDLFSQEGIDLVARAVTGSSAEDNAKRQLKLTEEQLAEQKTLQQIMRRIETKLAGDAAVAIKAPGAV